MAELALYPPSIEAPAKPLPLHRFLFRFVRNPLSNLPQGAYEQPLVWRSTPRGMVAWVTGPDLVEQVLVGNADDFEKTRVEKRVFKRTLGNGVLTAEGALWRWERRIMAPLFRHQEIVRYVPEMVRAAEEQVARWRASRDGTVHRVDLGMVDTTFAIISRTMLQGGEPAEGAVIKRETARSLDGISWEVAFALLNLPRWVPHPASIRLRRSSKSLRQAIGSIVARRRGANASGDDLLGRLLSARDTENGLGMDDEQVVDNLLTLLEAGHETTAKALSWTLYLLARSPEWQEKLHSEVSAVLDDGPFLAEHLERLPIAQQVLKEAMRLYPPVAMMARTSKKTVTIGGQTFPPVSLIVIPIFCIHRHRQLWDDPEKFDPTRFSGDKTYPRTQFMPFGAGSRICLGSSFAMMEATAILAVLVKAARFEWDGTSFPEPISRITLQPKGGVPLRVYLRS